MGVGGSVLRKMRSYPVWQIISGCMLLAVASSVCSRYLGVDYVGLWQVALFVTAFLAAFVVLRNFHRRLVKRVELALLTLFSLFLSGSVVIGHHIVIANGNTYGGLLAENYIAPFAAYDLVALVVICLLFLLYSLVLHLLFRVRLDGRQGAEGIRFGTCRLDMKLFIAGSVLIMLLWLPYLLAFWPGFIFGDTISSISQAIGDATLSNHHPVFYTMLIKCAFKVAALFGYGRTTGLALLSAIQMLFLAGSFAYSASWVHARLRTPKIVSTIVCCCIGFSPALGAFSVAMWKDPIFTAAFLILSLNLGDLVISRGKCAATSSWVVTTFFMSLIAMLMRNNGVYVVVLTFVVLVVAIVVGLVLRARRGGVKSGNPIILVPFFAALVVYGVVSGPVYSSMGVVPTEKVEALGVLLNQMARVAAYGGDMSESDSEYMNSMLALDRYDDVYTPCCTDMLKWNASFNSEPLNEGFIGHWLSMFVRNPRLYFESWVLQTYGFWTVNGPCISEFDNIGGGVPRIDERASEVHVFDIYPQNLFHSSLASDSLAWHSSPLPSGVLLWIFVFAFIELVTCGLRGFSLMLLPSIGVVGTLVIASPICYWPRYAMILNFTLPVLACFVLSACGAFRCNSVEVENDLAR